MTRWFSTPERPINVGNLLLAVALVLVAVSSLIAVTATNSSRRAAERRADVASDISNCRSKLATAVTDATTNYQFAVGNTTGAIGEVVTGLASGGDLTIPLQHIASGTADITAAAGPLDIARNLRLQFEANPGPACPAIPTPLTSTPVTPAPVPSSSSTTTVARRRTVPRRAATTSSSSSSTTSTIYHSSPTTVRPGMICDLVPLEVPCL